MGYIYKINIYPDEEHSEIMNYYIGRTIRTLEERMAEHLRRNRTPIERLMNTNPWDYEKLLECDDHLVMAKEGEYIGLYYANFHRYPWTKGLNESDGGERNKVFHCPECHSRITRDNIVSYNGSFYLACMDPSCRHIYSLYPFKTSYNVRRAIDYARVIIPSFEYKMLLTDNRFDRDQYAANLFSPFDYTPMSGKD